jgi:hypothetical protein
MLYYFLNLSEQRQQTLIEIAKDMLHADNFFKGGGHLTFGQDSFITIIKRGHDDESGHLYQEEPGR